MDYLKALHTTEVMKAPQVVLLRLLTGDLSGVSPTEIAESTGLLLPAISMAIDSLSRANLIERRYPARDRRAVRVYLTDTGRSHTEAMLAAMTAYVDDVKKRQGRVHP